MAKITRTLYKEIFQPDKNSFIKEPIEVSREESEFEVKNNKLSSLYDIVGTLMLVLFSLIIVLSGICLVVVLLNEPKYCLFFLCVFVPSLICAIFIPKVCFEASDKYYTLVYKYCEENKDLLTSASIVKIKIEAEPARARGKAEARECLCGSGNSHKCCHSHKYI